ncbi:MAG: hypothetical protein R3A13_11750 [Bdellovibrionota bacterium]
MPRFLNSKSTSPFTRRKLRLSAKQRFSPETENTQIFNYSKISVLLVNSSTKMAKEISHQLAIVLPNCSIVYAPSVELAKLILKRRKIDLVVANSVLTDGGIHRLKRVLADLENSPDLVIAGDINLKAAEGFENSGYQFAGIKRFVAEIEPAEQVMPETKVAQIGADLRNDLNNPLQEIVAMIFVARASGELNPATEKSLEAIDKAAKGMAEVVWGLEDKIKDVVFKS